MTKLALLLILLPALGGCVVREPVGPAYPRPDEVASLVIGQTREADILAVYGQPTRRTENGATRPPDPKLAANFVPYVNATLTYQSGDRVAFAYPLRSTAPRLRTTIFQLRDGVMTGYSFNSALPEDDRPLDVAVASAQLARSDLTQAQLAAVLGPPQSRQTYRSTPANAAVETDTWSGTVRNGPEVVGKQSINVTFGADGRMVRHTLNDVNLQR